MGTSVGEIGKRSAKFELGGGNLREPNPSYRITRRRDGVFALAEKK